MPRRPVTHLVPSSSPCLYCGHPFITRVKRPGKYCSDRCRAKGVGKRLQGRVGFSVSSEHRKKIGRANSKTFEERVQFDPQSGCLLWTGAKQVSGYGFIYVGMNDQGVNPRKKIYVHRYAYEQNFGSIPEGLQVCHTCDVRHCVAPSHLFLGTTQENTADREQKGRGAKGERQGSSHLTKEQVEEIRELYARGTTQEKLADTFGIHQTQISRIVRRVGWKHVE